MKIKAGIALVVAVALSITACTPHPRFRTGGEEVPPLVKSGPARYTTDDFIRLGLVLQSYLGKPYAGRSRYEKGVDCSAFVLSVMKQFDNIELPRTVEEQYRAGLEIHHRYLDFGDLVFFRTVRNQITHVGIYVGEEHFVHASTSSGVIISSLRETYWAERFAGSRRVLEH